MSANSILTATFFVGIHDRRKMRRFFVVAQSSKCLSFHLGSARHY